MPAVYTPPWVTAPKLGFPRGAMRNAYGGFPPWARKVRLPSGDTEPPVGESCSGGPTWMFTEAVECAPSVTCTTSSTLPPSPAVYTPSAVTVAPLAGVSTA